MDQIIKHKKSCSEIRVETQSSSFHYIINSTVDLCRHGDQLPAEAGADHRGHAALHLHARGVEVAGVCRQHHQRRVDEAVVGDEVRNACCSHITVVTTTRHRY